MDDHSDREALIALVEHLRDENRELRERCAELRICVPPELRSDSDAAPTAEASLRATLDAFPNEFFIKDRCHRYTYANPAVARLLGLEVADIVGRTADEFLGLEFGTGARETDLRVLAGETTEADVDAPREGAMRRVVVTKFPVRDGRGAVIGIAGVGHDVTRRKAAEEQINLFKAIIDASQEAIAISNRQGELIYVNPAYERLFGRTLEETRGLDYHATLAPEVAEFVDRRVAPAVSAGASWEGILEAKGADGSRFPVWTRADAVRGADGSVLFGFGLMHDVREEMEREAALRRSEETARALLDVTEDLVVLVDLEGRAIAVNEALAARLGRRPEELLGTRMYDYFTPEVREIRMARAREAIRSRQPVRYEEERQDAALSICIYPIPGADGDIHRLAVFTRDVTDRRQLEQDLRRMEKIESIGLLAGGIAHDFNNILVGILGNVSLARALTEPASDLAELLAETESACARARDLTEQLLTFAKGGEPIRKPLRLHRLVRETVRFALHGTNVRCEFDLADDARLAEVDEGQIGRVVGNLALNAVQAMPDGGVLRVRLENVAAADVRLMPVAPGAYVRLSVQDEGVGIPPRHLDRVFDPFFGTKEKGRGLGLSVAYSIVKGHGGLITVESKVGVGTTFQVILPATDVEPTEEPSAEIRQGSGRVLLVDDEEIVRKVATKMLARLGYEPIAVRNSMEAMQAYREAREAGRPFGAVIVDLTIPGEAGGRQLVADLLTVDPAARVLVSSGYSSDPIMANHDSHGFCGVVRKPYSLAQLAGALARAMVDS